MRRSISPLLITSILLITPRISGCGDGVPPTDPTVERFKDYYADELVQREISRLMDEEQAVLDHRLDSLRRKFSFSGTETDSLFSAMRDSLPLWESFLNDVLERIEARERALDPGIDTVVRDPGKEAR